MAVLTFRVNVPSATPATTPVEVQLMSGARFIKELIGPYSLTANLDISKTGFRLYDRSKSRTFIPEVGSSDNSLITNPNEAGWAPILSIPQPIAMLGQVISGPPYILTLAFFNTTGSAVVVAGFIVVQEKFAAEDTNSMIYEIVTQGNPPRTFMQPYPVGLPMEKFGLTQIKK